MSFKKPKPRLGWYKSLLGHADPDLDQIIAYFIEWSKYVEYLIFRKENIYTYEKEYKAVKAAKRGNDVYAWKLKKRLRHLYNLPQKEFFNFKDRSRRQKTQAIFVTLTYRRDISLDEAWEQVGSDYNRWITRMRKTFGKIDVIRCWEAQGDGYPHIHCVLLFHEAEFKTYFNVGKKGPVWRVSRKRELEKYWAWGFSDMWALYSLGAGAGYVLKYVSKVNNALLSEKMNRKLVLSLALMWSFRKRAFSVSKEFGEYLVEEKDDRPGGQVDLEGKSIYKWYLVGFWADVNGEYNSWSVILSYLEFWNIYSSENFTINKIVFSD